MGGIPPFESAVADLQRFLIQHALPNTHTWIFREDIVRTFELAVRVPVPDANRELAEGLYETARQRGLGVALVVACRVGGDVAVYVGAPHDEDEAQRLLFSPDNLKISVPARLPTAREVHGSVRWTMHRWIGRSLNELPERTRK
jgi:hypothetical protein